MKKIIPIIIASLIAGQAYATRIINNTPGKMTVSPETVEAGADIVSRHTYPLDESKKKFSTGRTTTKVASASGRAGSNIRIDSDHYYEICNSESYGIYFNINTSLKSDGHASNSNSTHEMVLAKSCAQGQIHLYAVGEYRNAGTYRAYGETDIEGSNRSSDYSNITVSK